MVRLHENFNYLHKSSLKFVARWVGLALLLEVGAVCEGVGVERPAVAVVVLVVLDHGGGVG